MSYCAFIYKFVLQIASIFFLDWQPWIFWHVKTIYVDHESEKIRLESF